MSEGTFTAGDLKEKAGMTYRQLAGWEQRGTIPLNKARKEGWRKFTIKEVFGLMVCAEVRRQFGVPLESLRWLRAQLFRADAHPRSAQYERARKKQILISCTLCPARRPYCCPPRRNRHRL